MPLAMSRPWKHPKTGIYQLRKAVPEDLRRVVGKREEKVSLKTCDPGEAKLRFAKALAELETRWANLRAGPTLLTEREAHQIAVAAYDRWLQTYGDNPSQQTRWDITVGDRLFGQSRTTKQILTASQRTLRLSTVAREDKILQMEDECLEAAERYLAANGMPINFENRRIMARAIGAATQRACVLLAKLARGEGDFALYSPAATLSRANGRPKAAPAALNGSLSALVDDWWNEAKAFAGIVAVELPPGAVGSSHRGAAQLVCTGGHKCQPAISKSPLCARFGISTGSPKHPPRLLRRLK